MVKPRYIDYSHRIYHGELVAASEPAADSEAGSANQSGALVPPPAKSKPRKSTLSTPTDKIFKEAEKLKKRLQIHFQNLQKLMPTLYSLDFEIPTRVQDAKLYFPSAWTQEERVELGLQAAAAIEQKLRAPHCHDILNEVRNSLGYKSVLVRGQRNHGATGVAGFTRGQMLISRASSQAALHAKVYNISYQALCNLGTAFGLNKPAGALQSLLASDMSTLSEWLEIQRDIPDPTTSHRPMIGKLGKKHLPWFWRTIGGVVHEKDNETDIARKLKEWNETSAYFEAPLASLMILIQNVVAIRHEWLLAEASFSRWAEEFSLLPVELRRVISTFRYYEQNMAVMAISDLSAMSRTSQGVRAHGERKRIMWGNLADIAESCMLQIITMMSEKVVSLEEIPDFIPDFDLIPKADH